jgi:hypothetical protein
MCRLSLSTRLTDFKENFAVEANSVLPSLRSVMFNMVYVYVVVKRKARQFFNRPRVLFISTSRPFDNFSNYTGHDST